VAKFDPRLIPVQPDFQFETALWHSGISSIGGIDEAGRGSLAGPVAAAVIVFPPEPGLAEELNGVRDSKQLTAPIRELWAERLRKIALDWGIGFSSSQEIDDFGIITATHLAVRRGLDALSKNPEHLLLDYLKLAETKIPQTSLVKGDQRCLSIAAASILAKTARDEVMRSLDRQFPGYGFASHKGYGTPYHRKAISDLGPTPVHRLSFKLT